MRRQLLAAAVVVGLLAVLVRTASRRELLSPPHWRFYGALHAMGDLVWARAATRVAVPSQVSSKEAEEHYRMMIVAARLNPVNRKIYELGTFALAFWNRTDLALDFVRRGLSHHPGDPALERQMAQVIVLFNAAPEESLAALDVMLLPVMVAIERDRGDGPRSFEGQDPITPFLFILKARKEEEAGMPGQAARTWALVRDVFGDMEGINAQANEAISRLSSR